MKQTRQYMHGVTAWIVVIFAVVGLSSCLEEYLDRSPDSGLDENEVFSKFANFKSFFYSVYDGADKTDGTGVNIKPHYPLYHARWDQKMTMESLTDMCDMVRYQYAQPPKRGEGSELFAQQIGYYHNRAKVPQSWKAIRVCNMTIEHIDDVLDISAIDKNDFLGQAYFVRAFCHFELFRFYGSLPYIDKALGPNDEWDLPRMDAHDMLLRIAEDFETAATYLAAAGKTRRDPASGAGHLADPDQGKPNGATAKAFKARALLYAASPLNNPSNISAYWEEAAIACWDALSVALENGYSLLSKAEYTRNFYGTKYTNEHLWTDGSTTGTFSITNAASFETLIPSVFWSQANASGQCPTENFVTRFETDEGYPLYTDEERATAIAAGKYNAQNPYVHRDPRFDFIVIYNQKPLNGYGNASLYIEENGSRPAGSLMPLTPTDRYTRTGYYERKRTGDFAARSSVTSLAITDPIIRLAELYLNYAEAANEAYGPNGAAPGASLTALQALN
ncbi:MAG: RagB/SusD family nutrient uptake outer membrane protein, partial [Odoribacteraceae bacterium]|nr:RagB/SusD family nutrient uptake outer membrane protein [Odoribacteraceae bacterium]